MPCRPKASRASGDFGSAGRFVRNNAGSVAPTRTITPPGSDIFRTPLPHVPEAEPTAYRFRELFQMECGRRGRSLRGRSPTHVPRAGDLAAPNLSTILQRLWRLKK